MPTVADAIREIEDHAPRWLAEDWDRPGLAVGHPDQPVSRVLVALDATPAVVAEAVQVGAELIVCHHPPLFQPIGRLDERDPAAMGALAAFKAGLAVYAAHTNLDAAPDGLAHRMAQEFGVVQARPLRPAGAGQLTKIAVFVPRGNEQAVLEAMASAGAGHIGNYSHCSFQSAGTGTFLPLEGSNPYLGRRGELERADEIRLEMISPNDRLRSVIDAMLAAHPYEEVAYDLYPLKNRLPAAGLGRAGRLVQPMTALDLARRAADLYQGAARLLGPADRLAERLAVCPGAGGDLLAEAAAQADVLVTGELSYHRGLEALERGLVVIELGHQASERRLTRQAITDFLRDLAVTVSEARADEHDPLWITPSSSSATEA